MKPKLQLFTGFANNLLPHEAYYLRHTQQFADPDNLSILERVCYNAEHFDHPRPYDEGIDKRKYSRLKRWMQHRLQAVDVDARYAWIIATEQQIMTDTIGPEAEQDLLRRVRKAQPSDYNFLRFYEMLRHYRQYLLIRMRHKDHQTVDNFLHRQAAAYARSQETYEQLHQVTVDIINQYARNNTETAQWEQWLAGVFADAAMDGLNRYHAVVRLTFLYLNYRNYAPLEVQYDALDQLFRQGRFYSRRILLNYYSNRVLLHARTGDLTQAIRYGYLSIRQKNADYLHYVNNLSAILLRQGDKERALHLMEAALPEMRRTKSFHNRVGFAAFYIRCLNENEQVVAAARYAERFLRGYKEQVFAQRWHAFFTAYLQVLMHQEQYEAVLKVVQRYRLMDKEAAYRQRAGYLPTITWYREVARYKEGRLGPVLLAEQVQADWAALAGDPHKQRQLHDLVAELYVHVPEVFGALRAGEES